MDIVLVQGKGLIIPGVAPLFGGRSVIVETMKPVGLLGRQLKCRVQNFSIF